MLKYLLLLFISYNLFGSTAGNAAKDEPRYIIDMPNAGILANKHISVTALAYTDGGVMVDFTAAFFDKFNIGISYGANKVLGSGTPLGQKYPGINIKYRIVNESTGFPALVLGFSNQGRGNWIKTMNGKKYERFETFSPGIYLAASKNFDWTLGEISLHGGVGYSIDPKPGDRFPNFWVGAEQNLGDDFSITGEINFLLDSQGRDYQIVSDAPLLNLGVKWSASEKLSVQLQFRDLIGTYKIHNEFTRFLVFDFITPF